MIKITWLIAILNFTFAVNAQAAAPTMDSFHVQSFLRLSNNTPVSATSGNFVFAIFKGSSCLWAKRYTSVAINTGVLNQSISGNGTNITSISNGNATAGECVANFSGSAINSTLLNTGAAAGLSIRIYAESTIDGYQPIWDIPLKTSPTALVADTATSATSANDIVASKKVAVSAGATDAGKFVILDGSGSIDSSMIGTGSLTISNTQVTGLGTASTKNTGTASGDVPLLTTGGKLPSTMMPALTANKIVATDGTGAMIGTYSTVTVSAGATDAGKMPVLNSSGQIDGTMVDTSGIALNPVNLTTSVAVNKGGTGVATLPTGSLIVGAGTSAVTSIAPSTSGNILTSNGTTWSSQTADAAGVVNKTTAQTIAGNKTWTGTFTLGTGGATFSKILNCSIASAAQTSGTERTGTCTGTTTSSIVNCSPTVNTGTAWLIAAARASAADTIAVKPFRTTGTATWTTAYNCIVFVP